MPVVLLSISSRLGRSLESILVSSSSRLIQRNVKLDGREEDVSGHLPMLHLREVLDR